MENEKLVKQGLLESSILKPKVLDNDKNKKNITFECVLQKLDQPGQNGRIYPKILMESQLKKVEPLIKKKMMYGELDHPISNDPDRIGQPLLKEVSHVLIDYSINDDNVMGVVQTLPTPNGEIVKSLILNGNTLGISLRALGSVKEVSQTRSIVEDIQLVSYDIVANPSFLNAIITKQSLVESIHQVYEDDVKVQNELFKFVFTKKLEQLFENYNIYGHKQKLLLKYIRENY